MLQIQRIIVKIYITIISVVSNANLASGPCGCTQTRGEAAACKAAIPCLHGANVLTGDSESQTRSFGKVVEILLQKGFSYS